MNALMERTGETREELYAGVCAIYEAAKAMLDAGQRPRLTLTEDEDGLTLRQMRFIHGPILQQISEQMAAQGVKFTRDAWKTHLKEVFFPDEFEMVQAPFVRDAKTGEWRPSKRKVPRKKEKSLTKLTGKRRSEFIDWALAYAAVEWGVVFHFHIDEREAVRYVPPKRKVAEPLTPVVRPVHQQREAVPA